MSLGNNALVSLDEVKQFYFPNMDKSKSQDDDLLEELINRITSQFEKYCGITTFHDDDYTEYTDSVGACIFTKNQPINSITSIALDTDWTWGTDSTCTTTDYRIINDSYVLFKYQIGNYDSNVKIIYNGGYETIPADLKHSCIKEVAREYKHRQDFDILSKSLEDGSNTVISPGLMFSTIQILDKYKRIRAF